MALRKRDIKEYNSDRRAHNKKWAADIPRLENEDGEEIDFWTDRAEDKRTHYIGDDICEEMDRKAAEPFLLGVSHGCLCTALIGALIDITDKRVAFIDHF